MNSVHGLLLVAAISLFTQFGFAGSGGSQASHPGQVTDDSRLVAAFKARRGVDFIEAGNLVVTKLLPDDNQGLRHQKWQARLSNGGILTIVYNSDMDEKVPLNVGDVFSVGGQFIWTGNGGLIHWVHDDPKGRRPDGYVLFDGVQYGDLHRSGRR